MKTLTKIPTKKTPAKKNSNIQIGILKGRMSVARDTFEEDNKKTLDF